MEDRGEKTPRKDCRRPGGRLKPIEAMRRMEEECHCNISASMMSAHLVEHELGLVLQHLHAIPITQPSRLCNT